MGKGFPQYRRTPAYICLYSVSLALVALSGCSPENPWQDASTPMNHVLYVWQREWTPEVHQAIQDAAPSVHFFMILSGELEKQEGGPRYSNFNNDWQVLASTGRDVWLVFRACTECLLVDPEEDQQFITRISDKLHQAEESGGQVAGVQVDYDCPTARLDQYAAFIQNLRRNVPDMPVSVTALPTWLPQHDFKHLLAVVDHYVLQVHWLERPRDIHSSLVLFDGDATRNWLEQAATLGAPFFLALPTYGYRVYFDRNGSYAGLGAEQDHRTPSGYTGKDVGADPEALADLVNSLNTRRPSTLSGLAWFRLPVASDAYNWSWPVLEKVMRGVPPCLNITAEIKRPQSNLYEVWLENRGDFRTGTIRVTLTWQEGGMVASDALNGFKVINADSDAKSLLLEGPVTEFASPRMVFWARMQPSDAAKHIPLKATSVEMAP